MALNSIVIIVMFSWNWRLKDLQSSDKNVKVFSCFSCGGGSSLGYKRAGFDVIGNVEIDKRINQVYVKNLKPKYNFCLDLRDFNKLDNLPDELFNLDILDASPPCTPFSVAGQREKTWQKKKKFYEGQKLQTLDDLFFVFLDTVAKLQPKIVIAENVTGLIKGNAKGYVNEILNKFRELKYDVQLFQLNSAFIDVPQIRERIFFIANNQNYPRLKLDFNHKPITFGEVRTPQGKPIAENTLTARRLKYFRLGDRDMGDITKRVEGRDVNFNVRIVYDSDVACTLTASSRCIRACDKMFFSRGDYINVSTFPQDYDFGEASIRFVTGMCVPPNMTANLAMEIYKQWL